ncbi:MAG: nucleotidyl transferase AbiEii/AbiGii toxin family protein [Firmicutes bacterium]|nr:nucleotidyl transferase AbiEii/AbiGii toxin family protein [Bacillota bacterium]
MTSGHRNKAASVRARLTRLARQHGREVDSIFLQYMQERLLFRISKSQYSSHFVLKGGVFLFALHGFAARPTRDIDFLARHLSNDDHRLVAIFREIAAITDDDGVTFDPESVSDERITELAAYPGVSINLDCSLEQARKRARVDIGFGDAVVPKAIQMDFPILLDGQPPRIWAYSIESVIAEKFEAMLRFSTVNSRMKDFYDVYWLSLRYDLDGRILQEAIQETLGRRGTPVDREPAALSVCFAEDPGRLRQWSAFLSRIGCAHSGPSLAEVMERIRCFLGPVFEALCTEGEFFRLWVSSSGQWEAYGKSRELMCKP